MTRRLRVDPTAMRAANGGAGVLRLYGNYGGDVMNFDMAGEMVEFDDISSTTVLLADDVASAPLAKSMPFVPLTASSVCENPAPDSSNTYSLPSTVPTVSVASSLVPSRLHSR